MRHKVESIEISRVEGPEKLGATQTFRRFDEASEWLWRNSFSLPEDGVCHKHAFIVTWVNGDKYFGCVKHSGQPSNELNLLKQVLNTLKMMAGEKPAHLAEEKWAEVKARFEREGTAADARRMLETLEFRQDRVQHKKQRDIHCAVKKTLQPVVERVKRIAQTDGPVRIPATLFGE